MMFLAVAGLMVPALFHFTSRSAENEISIQIAVILLLVYGLSLVYTLFTHRKLFEVTQPKELEVVKTHSWKRAWLLAGTTLTLALMSEILTDALEPATKQLGINEVFAGIILLASVSNISSIMNAVVFARKNQMDLATSSVIGAATQIAPLGLTRPGTNQPSLAHANGFALHSTRTGRADHLHLHRQKHDDRRRVRLAGRGDAHRGLRDAGRWILLHRLAGGLPR